MITLFCIAVCSTATLCNVVIATALATNRTTSLSSSQSTSPAAEQQSAAKGMAQTNLSATQKSTPLSSASGSITVEPQSTDLSSMYVQVPIAEPVPSDGQQQQIDPDKQSEQSYDDSKPTKWTGAWPKKFQIGYIKQSDLHQVLIESLKGDAFAALDANGTAGATSPKVSQSSYGTKSAPDATKSTRSSPVPVAPSDSSSLMGGVQVPKIPQWPPVNMIGESAGGGPHLQQQVAPAVTINGRGLGQVMNKNIYRQNRSPSNIQQQHGFNTGVLGAHASRFMGPNLNLNFNQNMNHNSRPFRASPMLSMQQPNGYQQQVRDHLFLSRSPMVQSMQLPLAMANHRGIHFTAHNNQQVGEGGPKMISMTSVGGGGTANDNQYGMQQQQQQQFQFATNSFKNQPVYSTIQQQQMIEQMDLLNNQRAKQQQQDPIIQQQKSSAPYYSSWKPVVSDNTLQQVEVSSEPKSTGGAAKTAGASNSDSQAPSLNDGFDDGFAAVSDGNSSDGSMNRHPTLSGYLSSNSNMNGKQQQQRVSPSKRAKNQVTKQQQEGTKASSSAGETAASQSTKGVGSSRPRSMTGTKSTGSTAADRSASPGTTTTPAPTSTEAVDNGSFSSNETTTPAAVTTTTTASVQQQTTLATTSATVADESETTEPDSEVFGGEVTTTESSAVDSTTTQVSSTTQTTTVSTDSSVESNARSSTASSQEPETSDAQAIGGGFGAASSTDVGRMREETTPTSGADADAGKVSPPRTGSSAGPEVEGAATSSTTAATPSDQDGDKDSATDDDASTLTDEALMAAAKSAEIGKASRANQQQRESNGTATGATKRARSSERIVAQSNAVQSRVAAKQQVSVKPVASASTKSVKAMSQQKLAAKGGERTAKQLGGATKSTGTGTGAAKSLSLSASAKKRGSSQKQRKSSAKQAPPKSTRMAPGAQSKPKRSDRLQQSNQMVSMSAAQAQSTAQTLASLLLARCLSSTNCAHLLDICATKQAAVPLQQSDSLRGESLLTTTTQSSLDLDSRPLIGWSVPVGLMSGNLVSLAQALQADKVLRVFPTWKESAANVVDQESQSGYTLLLPSNEALDQMPVAHLEALQANSDRLQQVIEAHMLDTAEQFAISNGRSSLSSKTRLIREARWPLQVNQHRDRHLTINGKRVIYANQPAPGK